MRSGKNLCHILVAPAIATRQGLSRGLRIHTLTNNRVYVNIALMNIVDVGQIIEILILDKENDVTKKRLR